MAAPPPPLDTQYDPNTMTWSGPPETHDKSRQVGEYVLNILKNATNQDKIVQIFHETGERTSVREMYLKTVRIGLRLQKAGVNPGDVVSVISQIYPITTPLLVAILAIGGIASFLDDNLVTYYKDEKNDLRRTKPQFIICDAAIVDQIMEFTDDQTIFTFGDNGGRHPTIEEFLVDYEQEVEELIPVKFKELEKVRAVIVPTSGTTGMPKLICLSHAMLLSHFFRPIVHHDSYEFVMLNVCPMFWISGVVASLQDLSELRTRIVTNLKTTPESIIELSQKHNVTDVFCNSTIFTGCSQLLQKIKIELPTIRTFSASGTIVPYHCVVELRKYLPNGYVMSGYGLSELSGIITIDIFGPEGSVGLLTKGMHLRIKDEDGKLLGPNETGLIWAKAESEFLDYLNNEPPRHLKFDSDGFINSFDIGYFDDDGFLYVTGRRDDMLEYMHNPVYSTKIETILLSHPNVTDVCVVGVRVPPYFDIPTAMVVKEAESELTAEDVQLWIKDKLPSDPYKLRGGVYFVDQLPRTITGKIKKHLVKMQAFELFHESGTKVENFK